MSVRMVELHSSGDLLQCQRKIEMTHLKTAQFKELLVLQDTEACTARVRTEYKNFLEKSLALEDISMPEKQVTASSISDPG